MQSIAFMLFERWYVFLFLISYLFIAYKYWGMKQSLKFLFFAYLIAAASEISSIRNGFPYGFYEYHYDVLKNEPIIFGVPIWDSLSYAFLAFASLMCATFIRIRFNPNEPIADIQRQFKTILLAAFYMMMIDVVIDPIAHQGDQWFLGSIYHYPKPGIYFDVPFSNFAGWFLVGVLILSINAWIFPPRRESLSEPFINLGVLFYFGIFLFNFVITLIVGDYKLALFDVLWGTLLISILIGASRYKNKIPFEIQKLI